MIYSYFGKDGILAWGTGIMAEHITSNPRQIGVNIVGLLNRFLNLKCEMLDYKF